MASRGGVDVRVMFTIYVALITGGVALYTVVGLRHL
jgi:hypothetical protein